MIKKPVCIICTNVCELLWKDVRSWDVKGKFDYFKCVHCGLVFLVPLPKKRFLSKYYDNLSYWGIDSKKHDRQFYIKRADKNYGYIYKLLNKFGKGKVLDVGAGSGLFLYKLKIDGWKVLGTEVSANARRFARRELGVDMIPASSIRNNKFGSYFDVVILNNVIEHLPDPVTALQNIYRLLKKDGVLLIITPNSGSFGFKLFRDRWYHLDPGRHLYIFNSKNIITLLEKAEFSCEKFYHGYFPHNFSGIFESLRHMTKKINKKKADLKVRGDDLKIPNFKDLSKISSYLLSYFISFIANASKRGEVVMIHAKKD